MVSVIPVSVDLTIPQVEVDVVVMQPLIRLRSQVDEPFQWSEDGTGPQLAAIQQTLDVAQSGIAGRPTKFTLFPEYSIPGTAGVDAIKQRIGADAWPSDTVVIAGVHGLDRGSYGELCALLGATVSPLNSVDSIPKGRWVNTSVTWVKDTQGLVRAWVQPKIRPAWPELNVHAHDMFCGSSVYVFEGKYSPSTHPCRFLSLVCYDWVAAPAGRTVRDEILDGLSESHTPIDLDWVFVIQHNPKPNHTSFLAATRDFLVNTQAKPFVHRHFATVVHANTAASAQPSRGGQFGFSACVFPPTVVMDSSGTRPTVCTAPKELRGSDVHGDCVDAVFREMGECVHSYSVRAPRFVTPDPTDRVPPLLNAAVFPLGQAEDPRLCSGPVPAAVKWVNDTLDDIQNRPSLGLLGHVLEADAEAVAENIIAALRVDEDQRSRIRVNAAACYRARGREARTPDRQVSADRWRQEESDALEHVVYSLTLLGLPDGVDVASAEFHGQLATEEGFLQVVAIRGETHEDCRQHFATVGAAAANDPRLVVVRDRHNLELVDRELTRVDEVRPNVGVGFMAYQTLIRSYQGAQDADPLRDLIDAHLPADRRFI